MSHLSSSVFLCPFLLISFISHAPLSAADGPDWSQNRDGRVQISPVSMDQRFLNQSWPDELERDFQDRVNYVIQQTARSGRYGGTFFENEKRAYGWAMLSILGGFEQEGIAFLESEDADAERWHQHTRGIDFYPSFTLKHQVRKYFFFGHALNGDYRNRMREGARLFTERDPLRRPHHAFVGATGWGPDAKNSWVDVRNTDNLKLMRETSIYLFAEETGNEDTRRIYQERLREFIVVMYQAGMGEWDSENYLGHTIAPLLNLYDFAKDDEVKMLAKLALDRAAINLATKYWRGNYCGPSRRDYNHPYSFGGSAAMTAWLWFGDSPQLPTSFESDEAEIVTSNYRPPLAAVELAHRNFSRPLTIWSSKPGGSPWSNVDAEVEPEFIETTHYGQTFQFGSLALGSQNPDINGFKLLTYSSERGADTIMSGPVSDPTKLGSPMYQDGILANHSVVAQYDAQAVYLTESSDQPYLFLIPKDAELTRFDNVLLIELERTSLAIWPINLRLPSPNAELTELVQFQSNDRDGERQERWPTSQVLSADRIDDGVYGFAIEVNDTDRDAFRRAVQSIRPSDDEVLVRGATVFTGVSGKRMRVQWGNVRHAFHLWLDGQLIDWMSQERQAAYHTPGGDLISQPWHGDGILSLQTPSATFEGQVTPDGQASFSESFR